MKIALICPYPLEVPGGVREHALGLYREFKKKGHKVKIISPRSWFKKYKNPDAIPLGVYLKIPSNKDKGFISLCDNSGEKIQKILKKEKFDVIHFHEPFSPFLNLQILKHSTSINIATFHAYPEASIVIKTVRKLTKRLWKKLSGKIDGTIAVSVLARKYPQKILNRKIVLIPNGVDLSRFNRKAPKLKRFQNQKLNILFVGRLNKRKGLMYLLKAYRWLNKKHPNIRLVVVGGGDQREEAKDYVKKYKLKNIFFEGVVSDKLLPSYYATADIFCSPATEGESFGIVLLEAMASGVPIVAFANAGYKGVLKGFGAKSLVPPKNVNKLVNKLEKLIKNKELRNDLKKWGLKEVQKYSWEKVAGQVLGFYRSVTQRKGKN